MKKRRTMFLTDFIANQYPIEKFKEIIFVTLDIVENFLLTLESGFDYNSVSIASYGEKYGSSQRNTHSKVESICIKNMQTQEKMTEFLESYFDAYRSLNQDEKNIFDATFIDKLTDLEIIEKYMKKTNIKYHLFTFESYNTHSKQIRTVRKSAIVRFCLRAGLDKFVDKI